MADLHISERLVHLMREHEDAMAMIERLPKGGVKWAMRESVDCQMQAVRDAMVGAWVTCHKLKLAAEELSATPPKNCAQEKP